VSLSTEKRESVRVVYNHCCGYCGVSEIDAGNKLDVDHYRPVKCNGTDDVDNLVYVCPACNRYKGEYWPQEGDPDSFYLLHPDEDDVSAHIMLATNGRFVGLTPRGWFHIRWLHLNRPQLIGWRLRRRHDAEMQETLRLTEATHGQLWTRIRDLEKEVLALQEIITRLT